MPSASKTVEVKNSTYLKVVETDTLLFEYVMLPIADLSNRYLYRFVEPVPTGWTEGKPISLIDVLGINGKFEDKLRREAMKMWYKLLDDIPGEWPVEAQWLKLISKVTLRECHIVPKE
jgi:hypothetical protein